MKLTKVNYNNKQYTIEINETHKIKDYFKKDYLIKKNENAVDLDIHIFMKKNWLSIIKYFVLRTFSKNWQEIELIKSGNQTKTTTKITVLIEKKFLKNDQIEFLDDLVSNHTDQDNRSSGDKQTHDEYDGLSNDLRDENGILPNSNQDNNDLVSIDGEKPDSL